MDSNDQRLHFLFERYTQGMITSEEEAELMKLIAEDANDEEVKDLMNKVWDKGPEWSMNSNQKQEILQNILQEEEEEKKVRVFTPMFIRIAASVALLLVVSYSLYILRPREEKQVAEVKVQPLSGKPINEPVLKLSDGSQVELKKDNVIPQQGSAKVENKSGELSYENIKEKVTEIVYNEVITPRGGQYHLTLSDGSKVWLNADSHLKFPVSFSGDKREVQLTGEAYFEIAHNESMPFHVITASGMDVRVLGTHFNVMAYEDEATVNTTLLEGSVRVTTATSSEITLVPGQQAKVSKDNNVKLATDVDLNAVMGWRNNVFAFRNASIRDIMRELSRWYNLEVTYQDEISYPFELTVPREMTAAEVLDILHTIGGVRFEVNGKQVKVIGE